MLKQHNWWCSSILLSANAQDEDDRFNELIVAFALHSIVIKSRKERESIVTF